EASRTITDRQSHFSESEYLRYAAEAAQGRGISGKLLEEAVRFCLENAHEIVKLGKDASGQERYTTRELFEIEQKMLERLERLRGSSTLAVSEETLQAVLAARPTITAEQARAVERLTRSPDSVAVCVGRARTGKTFMLDAVREAFERDGFEVLGACLSGKAARGLEEGAGIKSTTLAKLVGSEQLGFKGDFAKGPPARTTHDATQRCRAAGGKSTQKYEPVKLHSKSVLVLDEAMMIHTRAMARIVEEVERAGARLLLVGDPLQLQPIEAGG